VPVATRPIVFLSDFGIANEWVGICHVVMARIAPGSRVVDLSHLVRPLDIASAALLLADSLPFTPQDAVVVAVVDPNVGQDREVAVEVESGRILVGPDNGLLSLAWEADGGVGAVREIASDDVIVRPIAQSFRARDTLCPAAAHLAAGVPIDRVGPVVDPATLTRLTLAEPETERGKIRCEVIDFNRFGNVQLNVREAHLAAAALDGERVLSVEAIAASADARRGETYADFPSGDYGVIFDSRGWLTVVRGNPASALEGLRLSIGDHVWITAARDGDDA
jgi:S-adenosylmethionine hydrolase